MIKKIFTLLLSSTFISFSGKNHTKSKNTSEAKSFKSGIFSLTSSMKLFGIIDQLMELFFNQSEVKEINNELAKLHLQLLAIRWKEYTVLPYEMLRNTHKEKAYIHQIHHILLRLNEIIIQAKEYLKYKSLEGKDLDTFIHHIRQIIKHSNLLMMDYMILTHEDLSIKYVAQILSEEKHHKWHNGKMVNTFKITGKKITPKKYTMKLVVSLSKNTFMFNDTLLSKLESDKHLTEENMKYIAKKILTFDRSFQIPLSILKILFDISQSKEFEELETMYKHFDKRWQKAIKNNSKLKVIVEEMEKENKFYNDAA